MIGRHDIDVVVVTSDVERGRASDVASAAPSGNEETIRPSSRTSGWAWRGPMEMYGKKSPSTKLDAYLRDRYGEEFSAYERRTKKLIPFVL